MSGPEYVVAGDDDSPKEQLINELHARANSASPSPPRFPEIRGLCRTCDNAHITRRQYDEMPSIRCSALSSWHRSDGMPHDIMECTEYRKRGQLSLREMADLALLVDARKKGGQYL